MSCQHVFRAKRKAEQSIFQDKLRKACKRESESSEKTLHRQQQNKEHMASVRAAESSKQTLHRQQQDKKHKANVRAAESSEQALHRQQQNREHMANVRAAESSKQALHRQQQNKEHMANVRATELSIEKAIVSFHSDIRNGPDFVCTCLMYRKSVVPCNLTKYSKCSNDVLNYTPHTALGWSITAPPHRRVHQGSHAKSCSFPCQDRPGKFLPLSQTDP